MKPGFTMVKLFRGTMTGVSQSKCVIGLVHAKRRDASSSSSSSSSSSMHGKEKCEKIGER